MDSYRRLTVTLVLCVFYVTVSDAGECCDVSGEDTWCSEYCCQSTTRYCCSNSSAQASSSHRSVVCTDWFKVTVWGPVIVGIIAILVMFFACFCFYKCQCRRARTTRLIIPPKEPHHFMIAKSHVIDPVRDHMTYNPNKFIIPRPVYTKKTHIEFDNENFEC